MRILVTGASGLLGLNLCLHLADSHQVYGALHSQKLIKPPFHAIQSDLMDDDDLAALLKKSRPELLIHCAAMANMDACETQPQAAQRVNAVLPGRMAAVCRKQGIRFIHISTDAVFDGKKGDYTEEDSSKPLSVYGRTKLEGESQVMAENPQALIARVNFYGYSLSGQRSLAEFFLGNLKAGRKMNGFVDAMFCPLYVIDLVDTLMKMDAKNLYGLFHVVSPESLSKYAFGIRIAEMFGLDKTLIQSKSINEGGLLAARSPRLTLKIDKLKAAKIIPPRQTECLDRLHEDYLEKLPEKIMGLGDNAISRRKNDN